MILSPESLRPLLRQMTQEMGTVPAIMHWLTGCPGQPPAQGPHSIVPPNDWPGPLNEAAYRGN